MKQATLHQIRCPYCNARLFDSVEQMTVVPYQEEADISAKCWRKRCEWQRALYLKRVEPGERNAGS